MPYSSLLLSEASGAISRASKPWEIMPPQHRIGHPEPIFSEMKDEEVELYRQRFAGSQAEREEKKDKKEAKEKKEEEKKGAEKGKGAKKGGKKGGGNSENPPKDAPVRKNIFFSSIKNVPGFLRCLRKKFSPKLVFPAVFFTFGMNAF